MRAFFFILAALLAWQSGTCRAASAQAVLPQAVLPLAIRLEYARAETEATAPLLIAVLTPQEGYYFYAHHGDVPRPTLAGLIADGQPVDAAASYPPGVVRRDAISGRDVPVYTGPAPVFLPLPASSDLPSSGALSLRVSLLLCSAAHCIPVDKTVSLPPLPASGDLPLVADTAWATDWRRAVPGTSLLDPPLPLLAGETGSPLSFLPFPGAPGSDPASDSGPGFEPDIGRDWDFSPRQAGVAADPAGLAAAIFWGLLAGLILNVMPCVLPVLTLKMLALLGPAGATGGDPERLRRFREHNLLFAAGVLTWFALLAAIISLLGLTWGGLFQYAGVVSFLAGLTGLLGLSMLNLCTLPILDLKFGELKPNSSRPANPRAQAYLTGLAATLLATPCSGPLLGGVLAWSAHQAPLILLLVFLGVGCGMALPYLLFAAKPSAVSLLPRPGPWLVWLERSVGLFLLAATLWLLVILPRATALVLASGLILLAIFLILRRAGRAGRSPHRRLAAVLAVAIPVLWFLSAPSGTFKQDQVWEAFTPESFTQALGRDRVLLEFTADWCPNCKALELTTLSPGRLLDWQKRYKLRLFRVDMTRRNPEYEALLRGLGSISIPLTAVFPSGKDWRRPLVLRDLYTPAGLEKILSGGFEH